MDTTVRIQLINENGEILLILERAGKVVVRADGTFFHKPGCWGLPGGRAKANETPYQAAHRELREETGLEADISPEPLTVVPSTDGTHEIWLFAARNPRGNGEISDPFTVAIKWIDQRLAYGKFIYKGKPIRIYETHMPLIQFVP